MKSTPHLKAEPEGLTKKEAWWVAARAGLGVSPDTPREHVATLLARARAHQAGAIMRASIALANKKDPS